MKGITWLASYPKSGNTWFRVFLANLLHSTETPININQLGGTPVASARFLFDNTTGLDSADLTFDEIDSLRPRVYEEIATAAEEPIFLKMHDAYTYNSAGVPLVSSTATNGAIYFIRNPLDVAVSFAHHSACEVQEIIDCMGDINYAFCKSTRKQAKQLRQILTSWSSHVLSWVDAADVRVHVVRYEDMHAKPFETFLSAVKFAGLYYTDPQILTAIRLCSFSELQRQESESGFREKMPRSQSFFRQGKMGAWQSVDEWQPNPIHPRHPSSHKWMVFPDWSVNREYYPCMDYTPPERTDPFMDLRVVEFILSLPVLPWLHKKYIVRRAMEGELPPEVLARPKTPLGLLHKSLFAQPNLEWADNWQPEPELLEYVQPELIPSLIDGKCNDPGLHMRPMMLNSWLRNRERL